MIKKRILFCVESLQAGGTEKVLVEILKRIDYSAFQVDVCTVFNKKVCFNDIPDAVRIYNIFKLLPGISYRIFSLLLKLNMQQIIAFYINRRIKSGYDVEIAFLEGMPVKFIAWKKSTAKKVAWVHCDLEAFHWTAGAYRNNEEEKISFLQMDRIVFVTDNARHCFNRLFKGMEEEKQLVIYDLVDGEEIRQKSIMDRPKAHEVPVVCSLGRLNIEKGIDRLIRVIARLRKEDHKFILRIVGDGEFRTNIEALIQEFGLAQDVILEGFKANPYPYLAASDIYISTSYSEGFSMSVAEAMCLGLPVVATHTSGPEELLQRGEFGLLVENSEEGIYKGLKAMISSLELRKEYAQKSALGATRFDPQKTTGQIVNLLQTLTDN